MKTLFYHIIIDVYLSLLVVAGSLCSCTDEVYQEFDFTISGKDVELTIPIRMPEMDVKTRSDISDVDCSGIRSLWIAVFDVSGRITSQKKDDTATGWYEVDIPADYADYQEPLAPTVTLKTKSGPSYIVAVANVDNEGVTSDNRTTKKPLRDLLTDNLTWEDFNKIAVVSFSENTGAASDLDAPNVNFGLPMSGCFSSLALGGTHPDDWSATDFQPVTIPSSGNGKVSIDGAIHLRRLVSHITFNLIADGNVVDLSVEGYNIFNAPNYSWLYERGMAENNSGISLGSNFGDQATDQDDAANYYHAPVSFPSHYITTTQDVGNNTTRHSFDFWMVENKHTGREGTTEYNHREVKANTTGEYPLYTALTGDSWTPNNLASYVTIYCNVTYKEEPKVDDNGQITDSGSPVYRMGVVEYTIHLGYIGDNTVAEETKARDFNSYRNTNYTYNIKVRGLNEIVVEANKRDERNSAEGVVTDVENPTILLDAHYACFNVVFTEKELQDIDNFGYLITTYESGSSYTYMENDAVSAAERKYIDWIELKPTTDATTLAIYCPARGDLLLSGQTDEDRVLPIDEFYKKVREANEGGKLEDIFQKAADGKYYFTVFVNEYTYEPRYGDVNWGKENIEKNWRNYVNQPTRHFYFRVRRQTSTDTNSVYARSKYAIAQQSIQTYYSTNTGQRASSNTAIGVEHINELQGLNLRNSFNSQSSDGLSDVNGRWNVDKWLTEQGRQWNNILRREKMLQIPDIPQSRLQGGPGIVSLESGWNPASGKSEEKGFTYLYAPKAYTGILNDGNQMNNDPQANSENRDYYVEAINSCMNRNRDENGNGTIDNEELKWYVPASGKYLRAILGRNSLEDPIMPYGNVSRLPNTDNAYNTRYLMYASNNKIVWAMEGTSMSGWGEKSGAPWNVRCIRNLGTDLTTIIDKDKIEMAYTHDEKNRRVIMEYYDQASIRTEKITKAGNTLTPTSGGMHLHPVTDPLNKVYYAFEYTDEVYHLNYGDKMSPGELWYFITNSGENANISSSLGSNWRIPNQKEVTIMRNLGLFNENIIGKDDYAVSCTYDFFTTDGKGTDQGTPEFSTPYPNHHMMGVRWDAGTRIAINGTEVKMYYRCVRDVEPFE